MTEPTDLPISSALVGSNVRSATRPEWGVGRVERVDEVREAGGLKHRVVVQFQVVGRKTLLAPPARLAAPTDSPVREAGWLDKLGGRTLDDVLTKIPAEIANTLGTPRAKLAAAVPLYWYDPDEGKSLVTWATRQSDAPDPLSLWTRDELRTAFDRFASDRDAFVRGQAALLRQKEGAEALRAWLAELPSATRERVEAALRRVI